MIELLFVAVAIAGMIGSIRQLYKDVITIHQFLFWMIIWLGIIVGIFFIEWLGQYTVYFGINRPLDFIIVVSIILLFWMLFKITIKQENISREITLLVRQQAMQQKTTKRKK